MKPNIKQGELFSAGSEFNKETMKIQRLNKAAQEIAEEKPKRKGRPSKDLAGQRFGKLLVLHRIEDSSTPYQVWAALCDCGCEIKVTTSNLRTLTHCGCEGYGRGHIAPGALGYQGKASKTMLDRKPKKVTAFSRLLSRYQHDAKVRGLQWQLSEYRFEQMTRQPCHYCGIKPNQTLRQGGLSYTYNGIDRKDFVVGYTPENTVPCCGKCNIAKGTMPYDEFLKWIGTITKEQAV